MKKLILKFVLFSISLSILANFLMGKVYALPTDGAGGTIGPGETSVGGTGTSGSSGQIFQLPNLLGFKNLGNLLTTLLSLAYFVAGIALFFNLVIGGIQWITAGGDEKAMTSARRRLTNAVIGLIIVVAAAAITAIITQVFGISILNGFKFR